MSVSLPFERSRHGPSGTRGRDLRELCARTASRESGRTGQFPEIVKHDFYGGGMKNRSAAIGGERGASREGVRGSRVLRGCFGILPPLNCSPRPRRYLGHKTSPRAFARFFIRPKGSKKKGGAETALAQRWKRARNSLAVRRRGLLPVNSPIAVSLRTFLPSFSLPRGHFAMETALDESLGYYSANSRQPVPSAHTTHRIDLNAEDRSLTLKLVKMKRQNLTS